MLFPVSDTASSKSSIMSAGKSGEEMQETQTPEEELVGLANDDIESTKDELEEATEDLVTGMIEQKKTKNRINIGNLQSSTDEYLENNKPENSKRSIKTAKVALESVIKQLHPEEDRKLEDIPEDLLAIFMEEFFRCVVKQDGSTYNASTLSTYYNSLARFFVEKSQLNIKTNEKFCRVVKVLARRQEESAKDGEIPGKNAAKAIPKDVLAETIAQGKIGYDEPRALTANVIKAFQGGFGIRNRTEMYNIMNGDIEIGPMKINGVPEYIELGERITKMRRGRRGQGTKL